jgi:hypothetical protein
LALVRFRFANFVNGENKEAQNENVCSYDGRKGGAVRFFITIGVQQRLGGLDPRTVGKHPNTSFFLLKFLE